MFCCRCARRASALVRPLAAGFRPELAQFFDNLSRAQVEREAAEIRWSRSVGNVDLKLDLYSDYAFD